MPRSHSHPGKGGEEDPRAVRAGRDDALAAEDLRRQVALLAEQVRRLGEAAAAGAGAGGLAAAPAPAVAATAAPPPRPRPAAASPPPQATGGLLRGAVHETAPIDHPFVEPSPAQRAAAAMADVERHLVAEGAIPRRSARLSGRGEPTEAADAAPAGDAGETAMPAVAHGVEGATHVGGAEGQIAAAAAGGAGAGPSEVGFAEQSSRLIESVVALAELAAIEIRAGAEFEAATIRAQAEERRSAPSTAHLLKLLERQRRMLAALTAQTERLERAGAVVAAQIRALEAEHDHLREIVSSTRATP